MHPGHISASKPVTVGWTPSARPCWVKSSLICSFTKTDNNWSTTTVVTQDRQAKHQSCVPLIFGCFNTTYLTLFYPHPQTHLFLVVAAMESTMPEDSLPNHHVCSWKPQLKLHRQFWIIPEIKMIFFFKVYRTWWVAFIIDICVHYFYFSQQPIKLNEQTEHTRVLGGFLAVKMCMKMTNFKVLLKQTKFFFLTLLHCGVLKGDWWWEVSFSGSSLQCSGILKESKIQTFSH